jgi:hypothetical protein
MNIRLLQACNEFATIAFLVASTYLLLIGLVLLVGNMAQRFAKQSRPGARPGENIHQVLKLTGRLWDHCRTASLLFLVAFILLLNFGRHGWWVPLPLAANIVIAVALALPLILMLLKFVQLLRYRFRLGRLLERHNAVAECLVEAQLRGNRVFHSIQLGGMTLDNVVVGRNGVYVLQLFLPPPSAESVHLAQGSLLFQPDASRSPLHEYSKAVRLLRDSLAAEISSPVTVLPVIVIPDCKIGQPDKSTPMLVNLHTCMSFVGWCDKSAYLMDEDIAAISAWLVSQSRVKKPHRIREATHLLGPQVSWPSLMGY